MKRTYTNLARYRRELRDLLTQLAARDFRRSDVPATANGTPRPAGKAIPALCPPDARREPAAIPVILGDLGAPGDVHATDADNPGHVAHEQADDDPANLDAGAWHAIVEASSEGAAVYDARGRITYANPRLAEMLGFARAALVGSSLYEIIAPESHHTLRADLERRRRGSAAPVMYVFQRADGTLLRAMVAGRPLTATGGQFAGGVYQLTDVTAWSQAEERFRQLYENLLDGVVYCDLEGRFIDCNPAYARMLGYTRDELRQLTYHDLTPTKWHAWEARLVAERILPTGCSGLYEKEYRRKDGSVFPVELSSYAIRDESGVPVGMWGIARDISARRRAADEITRAQAEVQRNARFVETLLEALPTPVFYKDVAGRYLGCNRAFTEHTGMSAAALRGRTVQEVWPEEDAKVYHDNDIALLRGEGPRVYEARVVNGEGQARAVVFSKGVFLDEHGQPAGLVGAFTDVTALKEAERAVRDSRDYLQTVIDGMVEPVLVVDREYRIVLANAVARAQQGAHVLVAGACARCHEVVHGRTEPCVCGDDGCPVRQVFATHAPVTVTHEHAEEGGGVRVVEILASPVLDERGAVVQVIQSYRDVTARRAAEERARQAAEERQRAARLSGRQRTVLELVARGLLNKQVAARLGIAERTVEDHRRRGMQMLGVRSVAELVRVVGAWG